ncbi:MAG TPA: hypothetical protein VKJ00_00900 [Thermoanaerobaculia bacterium]|nr:hypothetical protein [Thermoanaerobaculia bacterium]
MRLTMIAGLFVCAIAVQPLRADGLIYKLPDDGTQIRYEMELMLSAGGQETPAKGSVTVSSVGQTTVNDEKCRWIEIKSITGVDGQDHIQIIKTLVPEKELGKGKSPIEHIVRTWLKEDNGEVMEVKDLNVPQAMAFKAFLAGPGKNPGELEKIKVDGKLGELECAGVTGDQEFEGPDGVAVAIHFENRLHEKAPFGLVGADWKFEVKNAGQTFLTGTFKLTAADTSTTALSELPDKQ